MLLFFRVQCVIITLLIMSIIASETWAYVIDSIRNERNNDDHHMHPLFNGDALQSKRIQKRAMPMINFEPQNPEEQFSEYWNNVAANILEQQLESKTRLNTNLARNIIMFLGDGMSIPTISAGRVYLGGEEKQFSFEKFPYIGLSKTYCANMQVADSACTATAYLGGVKANYGTIGINAAVQLKDCLGQANKEHHVESIAAWAQKQGMATGLITTTSVTHASPAGVYAHVANRNWENDAEIIADNVDPRVCSDIATQLIEGSVGQKLNVIMGGGREHFLPKTVRDAEGTAGKRLDGRNLIAEWKSQHTNSAHFIQTRDELLKLSNSTTRVLGLFAPNHMPYHLDADPMQKPTLEEMTAAALQVLERQSNGRGYFLFVEGGRIDHAHHDTLALRAIDETAEFDKAIRLARKQTSPEDSLIVVTSDHSHTMSLAGYSSRKNDIFGINNGQLAADNLPYATLSYANGPGFNSNFLMMSNGENEHVHRKNLREINMKNKNFQFPSTVPLASETHGGDDVAVFAHGPYAHLFTGVFEQNFIPHAMGYAACLSEQKSMCIESGINRRPI